MDPACRGKVLRPERLPRIRETRRASFASLGHWIDLIFTLTAGTHLWYPH